MTPVAWLVLTLVSLMFSALFSGTEIAYITSDRVRVELDVKKGGMLSRILGRFYADPDFFISTILVGNNIMLVIYGMGAAFFIEKCWLEHYHLNQAIVLILSTLISTGVILITGEFFPKNHLPHQSQHIAPCVRSADLPLLPAALAGVGIHVVALACAHEAMRIQERLPAHGHAVGR